MSCACLPMPRATWQDDGRHSVKDEHQPSLLVLALAGQPPGEACSDRGSVSSDGWEVRRGDRPLQRTVGFWGAASSCLHIAARSRHSSGKEGQRWQRLVLRRRAMNFSSAGSRSTLQLRQVTRRFVGISMRARPSARERERKREGEQSARPRKCVIP